METSGIKLRPHERAGDDLSGRTWLRWLPLGLLLALVAVVLFSGAWRWLSLEALRDRREALAAYVRAHPVLSLELYAVAYMALVALSLPGALIMSLAGGYLFGALPGGAAALAGETAGALIMYAAARTALGPRLARVLARSRRADGGLGRIERGVRETAASTLLALRLMPGVPFCLVNLAAGLFGVRLSTYLWTTVLGIAPSTFLYCWIGQGLGRAFSRSGAIKLHQLVTPGLALPVAGLALLALTPVAARALSRRRAGAAPAAS